MVRLGRLAGGTGRVGYLFGTSAKSRGGLPGLGRRSASGWIGALSAARLAAGRGRSKAARWGEIAQQPESKVQSLGREVLDLALGPWYGHGWTRSAGPANSLSAGRAALQQRVGEKSSVELRGVWTPD